MAFALENQCYNKPILKEVTGNHLIADYFAANRPFMVSKVGSNECELAVCLLRENLPVSDRLRTQAQVNCGISPCDDQNLSAVIRNYCTSLKAVDIFGVWSVPYYDWLATAFCPNAHYTRLWGLEPYHFRYPWSAQLAHKKVLVVHPFETSIRNNYAKRKKLFENPDVLPEFELITIKAEQNIDNPNSNYFDTLERTKAKVKALDFDVALVGCGPVGLPLSSYIREGLNKTVIHLGGALQVLFGIIGKRWEAYPQFKNIINEHWTRPLPEELPPSYLKVEHGCYW